MANMPWCVESETKFCVVRQVMQSANCAPARQLKNVLVDLAWDAVVHQVKTAVNERQTMVLC